MTPDDIINDNNDYNDKPRDGGDNYEIPAVLSDAWLHEEEVHEIKEEGITLRETTDDHNPLFDFDEVNASPSEEIEERHEQNRKKLKKFENLLLPKVEKKESLISRTFKEITGDEKEEAGLISPGTKKAQKDAGLPKKVKEISRDSDSLPSPDELIDDVEEETVEYALPEEIRDTPVEEASEPVIIEDGLPSPEELMSNEEPEPLPSPDDLMDDDEEETIEYVMPDEMESRLVKEKTAPPEPVETEEPEVVKESVPDMSVREGTLLSPEDLMKEDEEEEVLPSPEDLMKDEEEVPPSPEDVLKEEPEEVLPSPEDLMKDEEETPTSPEDIMKEEPEEVLPSPDDIFADEPERKLPSPEDLFKDDEEDEEEEDEIKYLTPDEMIAEKRIPGGTPGEPVPDITELGDEEGKHPSWLLSPRAVLSGDKPDDEEQEEVSEELLIEDGAKEARPEWLITPEEMSGKAPKADEDEKAGFPISPDKIGTDEDSFAGVTEIADKPDWLLSPEDLAAQEKKETEDKWQSVAIEEEEEEEKIPEPEKLIVEDEEEESVEIVEAGLDEEEIVIVERPEEEKQEYQALNRESMVAPSSFTEDAAVEELNQLDVGPILKKKDLASPIEMLSPDEIEDEEEWVSQALEIGTVVSDRYKVIKLINEKKDHATYLVKDTTTENKKYILKEIIPPEMPKEELWKRRDKFMDTIRIIKSFTEGSLADVYDGFHENKREYCLMEYINGIDLAKLTNMATDPFTEKDVLKWGLELCDTVIFLHYRPKPFELGNLQPRHIMADADGLLKILNYDFQRYFDVNRTLEFMPDDPTKLYSDITKLARILYFLLTKEKYDEAKTPEWPENVGVKIQKLIEGACREGQRVYGDIKVFKKKLEDTQITEKDIKRSSLERWKDLPRLSFELPGKIYRALAGQSILVKGVEIILIAAMIFFSFYFNKQEEAKEHYKAPDGTLAVVFAVNGLQIYNPQSAKLLYEKPFGKTVSVLHPAVISYKAKGEKEATTRNVILAGIQGESSINIIDLNGVNVIGFIESDKTPTKMLTDEEKNQVFVLHSERGMISVIDLKTLKTIKTFPVGINPADFVLIPLTESEEKLRAKMLKEIKEQEKVESLEDEEVKPKKPQPPSSTLVVSNSGSRNLMLINTDNGRLKGIINVEGIPGKLAYSHSTRELFMLDKESGDVYTSKADRLTNFRRIRLTGEVPSDMSLDPINNELWLIRSSKNTLTILDLAKETTRDVRDVGDEPNVITFDRDNERMWVFSQKTKNFEIFETSTKEQINEIKVEKKVNTMCFRRKVEAAELNN